MKYDKRVIGFTIVELLIVIAIITLLTSLLLPALRKAKNKAIEIQCASNMRQTGIAIFSYASDNQSHAPMMMDMKGHYLWKMNHPFSGYLGVAKSVDCHSEIAPFQNCSPLLNCPLTRPLRPGEPNIEHGGTLPFVGNGRLMRTKFKVESVPDLKNPLRIVSNPTKMCLMGEYGDSWAPLHKHNLAFPHNNSNITGMPLKDCNSSNLLFVDGHVSLTKYSELADLPEFFYLTGTDQPPRY